MNKEPSSAGKGRSAGGGILPAGLYSPSFEHDSCGFGLVARIDGWASHSIVEHGVRVLVNLEHRGATGGDKATGDGAGLLIQVSDEFFREECGRIGIELPDAGDYGVGMAFMPTEARLAKKCASACESAAKAEGLGFLGWREVPVDATHLGELARSTMPKIRQFFVARGAVAAEHFESKLYVMRRSAEKAVLTLGGDTSQFYIASLSSKTIVYKGLLTGTQLAFFYPDMASPKLASAFALAHQRYSTNTLPSWNYAQPLRLLAHNGEINTLRGNINRMKAREPMLESEVFGPDIKKLLPVINEAGSDSAMFDNVLELLVLSGRSIPHSMMMMIPEAWGGKFHISQDKRAFYEYHSAIMEPWDGPAAMAFTDGRYVGAVLDRNGLRPARYTITRDGLVIMASESGVLDFPGDQIVQRGRLQPGRMFLVDLQQKRIVPDSEIKATVCRQRPYRHWVKENRIELRGLLDPADVPAESPEMLKRKQHAFGYGEEDLKLAISPMASHGQEAVGSMGDDMALAVLSERPQLLFAYFRQLFAQVTNPPIDPFREELVMSLMSYAGKERNMLDETPQHCRRLKLHHPVMTAEDTARLRRVHHPDLAVRELAMLFPAGSGGAGLELALERMFAEAERAVGEGVSLLLLTDRGMDAANVPMPVLLASAGLHHHLIKKGLRTEAGIIVETGEAREIMHFALLIGYGANAVCPSVAFATIRDMAEQGMLEKPLPPEEAMDCYITAVKKGLLKTFSRMGISTIRSYCGAQVFEAVGLGEELVSRYFCGTPSRVGGIGLPEIAAESEARHRKAFPVFGAPPVLLEVSGAYRVRIGGERHMLLPEVIGKLRQALHTDDYAVFKEYTRLIDERKDAPITLRGLLRFKQSEPAPLAEVEDEKRIVRRFVSSAMSFGSISKEAHEAIAEAMNRLGAASNSGEGGEDPVRYRKTAGGREGQRDLRSRVKQVASGRFGVTTEYLVSADELQIKIAQGAKPGEGGQLPGHKVTKDIAFVRHTMPGVTLISPPPHHDIYSIEDLAQLIHDLKCVNPSARVSVKLVSEAGVGTIAAGVAKARADMVLISGADGGTGASPLTSIKHAGLPWELGLSETQQTLVANGLRGRIRVQTDGQLRTGRDLAIAAMLGAEEFGFGTLSLLALGCVMVRKCHLNTCPVGVATQDPELRKKFMGKPEHIERLFMFLARDLRERMASLGFRSVDEMVGRSDLLESGAASSHPKARLLDFGRILSRPEAGGAPVRCVNKPDHGLEESLDNELIAACEPALSRREPVHVAMTITNVHRSVGTMLSGELVRKHGGQGLSDGSIQLFFRGSAGQSLGAFLAPGITVFLEGDTNDYLGKGMSGGRIIINPPPNIQFSPHENVIAGNTALYGATGGEVFLHGTAGERFAVRNSGARAVLEGLGDHGCEYMTGGVVVVLGQTGNNFAAGMSGGTAFVYDETQLFDTRCNLDMVDLQSVWTEEDKALLRRMIEAHHRYTSSARARMILDKWEAHLPMFVKVMPIDYAKALERISQSELRDNETVCATEEVYHG